MCKEEQERKDQRKIEIKEVKKCKMVSVGRKKI
jgi:hypothetical protein